MEKKRKLTLRIDEALYVEFEKLCKTRYIQPLHQVREYIRNQVIQNKEKDK